MILSILTTLALSLAASAAPLKHSSFVQKPKLVVVVVIDQFRADNLTRYASRFLPATGHGGDVGGFQYLMAKGAYYPAARFDVLQNMTCPGHATILTGSSPARSGIPINDWFDRAHAKMRYCVEDDQDGLSPRQLQGTTVGDELKNAGYPGKVVSLALKDRAAILLGGHRSDLTFWLGKDGKWTTSNYYAKSLPDWLESENAKISAALGHELTWKQTTARTGYSISRDADFSRTSTVGKFNSLESPYGVEITTDAALAALKGMRLGLSKTTDLLAVSISTHDLVGHKVGPNAPEMEDLTVVEDAALARLLNAIRKQVPGGMKNVVVALTADHGVSPEVGYLKAGKIDAGFIDQEKLMASAEEDLSKAFGKRKYFAALESLNFYFTSDALDHVKRSDLENRVKYIFAQAPGVAHVFSLNDYLGANLPVGENARQIQKSYIPGKSGDVVIIPRPFWMETEKVATHMTGYSYDRTVPLILSGLHVKSGVYSEAVDVVDLAPTLSFLLGILPPAMSEGRILTEAIGD
jgi:predicted AlkP superfamily pyrophosphatase or phosphodiesterase